MIQVVTEPSEDVLYEVVHGVRVEKPMGLVENAIAYRLILRLGMFCREKQLGHAAIETLFEIPNSGNDRKPDVAFVSFARWPADRPLPRVNAWPVAPDLAVEVISPTDKAFDVIEKVHEYFAGGVRQVWHVYSHTEQVFVFETPTVVRVLTRADELTAEPVVPGFRMPMADLFPLAEPRS
jgi:Uma2 family endonuclease